MSYDNSDLDLKKLMGEDIVSKNTDLALNSLMVSLENFSNTTEVRGTGNIFECAISLGDLDFDLTLDFFDLEPSKMDFILLNKISYLRRLIVNINNIFIGLIQDLECCTGDDRYNKTVVPIFKWLVEDKNGLCGTLLRISKDINKIYMPLKRILCLFRNVPGNPTVGMAGTDYLKFVYPIVEGLEKITNLLDNGRFLDILIIPIKDFHDKLVACSSGKDTDFYTGYSSLKDIISSSIYDELTMNLIDEIKRQQNPDLAGKSDLPIPPIPPNIEFDTAPNISNFPNYSEFSQAMYDWNRKYSEFKKVKERDYNDKYAQYLVDLSNYRKKKFESTLTLNNEKFENSTFAVELMVDDFKNKHRAICGCLGEIFRLDGFFVPSTKIIRNEDDLNGLIGEVEYRGIKSKDYYIDEDQKKIKIINQSSLGDIRTRKAETTFEETMMYPYVEDKYLNQISKVKTIGDVIDLNREFRNQINTLTQEFRRYTNFYDSVNASFYSIYLNEIESSRKIIALYKNGVGEEKDFKDAQNILYNHASYPPSAWITDDKNLTPEYQRIFGSITYKQYLKGVDELVNKRTEIEKLKEAYGRNHSVFKVVDNSQIECGCNLLCMVIKYIINLIMSIIKKLIMYITKSISNSITNKELQWWIKFITDKIKCIIDILNLSKDLKRMEEAFENEMNNAKNSIKNAPESVANCSTSKRSIIDDLNLYPEKAKVKPDDIKDITWVPDIYPGYEINKDVTPSFNNEFSLITDKVTYEKTDWKNRTIPTMILDCSIDFHAKVDWVPSTTIWKAFLNVELNINQFNSSPDVLLKGQDNISESQIIENMYSGILYRLFDSATKLPNFEFRIEGKETLDFNTSNLVYSLTNTYAIFNSRDFIFEDVKKVWFKSAELDNEFVKVYDRNQEETLKEFSNNIKSLLDESLAKLQDTEFDIDEVEQTSNKYCSPSALTVKIFEPVYKDPTSPLFPGEVIFNYDSNGRKVFKYEPVEIDGFRIIKNNIPFKLTLVNGSGIEYTVVALIDVCDPNFVTKKAYDKSIDGIFLSGRYDYFEFTSMANNEVLTLSEEDIIKILKRYLENIGAISSSITGPLGTLPTEENVKDLIDNTAKEILQLAEINIEQNEEIANQVIENFPDSNLKKTILMLDKLKDNFENILEEVELAKDLSEKYDLGYKEFNTIPDGINKIDQRLGIPLLTLNEEANVILTIHKKKLKLININSDFGLNSVLETVEIDYKEGEQLFVEFSTNGFEHRISWLNERKVGASETLISLNNLDLKPTQLGSYYKDDTKIALMCGKINDIIFTESSRDIDDWYNNSNTYRPNGTIGYYDFSVFDGYHVYSIPEFFKVTKLNSVATLKGILYESKEYTREEIMAKIQDGKFNEILSEEITIVGERPISVGGDFIWKNKKYYKNVSFGYLENFFCRDNLAGESFTISCWLKLKKAEAYNREIFEKQYIFSDTHNGNFIWLEKDLLHIQLFGQYLRTEPVNLLFIKDLISVNPEYVEKWFQHIFRYDKSTANVYYTIRCIDQKRNFDESYNPSILDTITIKIPLKSTPKYGKKLNFSLVTMLARFDVEKLLYTDNFWCEIAALAIWKEFKDDSFMDSIYNYQRRIIINEMD
jgi:hypothetical protein